MKHLIHGEYKDRRKRFAAKLADNPARGDEFRAIREVPARPIQFLADEEGTSHTDPMMTDSIMTKAWAEVYEGTAQDMYRENEKPITVQ